MAIKLKLRKDPWKGPKRGAEKKTFPESIEWLAEQSFNQWRRDGSSSRASMGTYFKAVQLGFVGHFGKWVEHVLASGGVSSADFPNADPHDRRPDRWPDGKPEDLEDA